MINITNKNILHKEDWIKQVSNTITNPNKLLQLLNLKNNKDLNKKIYINKNFPLRVPFHFFNKIKKNDPFDPLLLQILTVKDELKNNLKIYKNKYEEFSSETPWLIHKYCNRVLLLIKNYCAINCRYCFRRDFLYKNKKNNRNNLTLALNYINKNFSINEVILSGGDPLMLRDHKLDLLISKIESISHIKYLRIHTRLPIVIPNRITDALCDRLSISRLKIIIVTHINHANEIDNDLIFSIKKLKSAGVILFNQSVLLKRVNDDINTLSILSNTLFNAGILPYYLHLLDKIQGITHFLVSEIKAKLLIKSLVDNLPGYLVPKLVKNISYKSKKDIFFS